MAIPDKSEPIRCGMCGKLNSADRAMCEYCGARLRPMTAEELGLTATPSEPARPAPSDPLAGWDGLTRPLRPSEEQEPPQASGTDTLHMRFEEEDDPTIVGPSAAKTQLERDQKTTDEEPDFSFGGREDATPGDVPDWLREASKRAEEPESAEGAPDWLAQEAGTETPNPIDIPDWLGAESPTQPPAPRASEEDMPDWLRAADERDAQREDRPDWLSDTARSESTQPMPRQDETPDWLQDLSQPATLEPSEPAEGGPDWLSEISGETPAEARQEETPDWLRSPEDIQGEEPPAEPPKPAMPPPPKRSGVTDWLRGLGVDPTAEQIQAALPQTPETAPSDQGAADEPELTVEPEPKPARPMSSIPLDETPDWLLALEAQTTEEAPESPGAEIPSPLAAAPVEPESLAASAEESALDWLQSAAEESPALPPEAEAPPSAEDWLNRFSGEAPPAASEPAAAPDEAPDWLRAPSEESPAEPPEWLSGIGAETASAAPSEPEGELLPLAGMGSMPDWLRSPEEETPVETPQAEAASAPADAPEWLSGMGAEPESPDIPASLGETPAEPAVDVPDWLSNLGGGPAAPIERAPEAPAEPVEAPEWLSNLAAPSTPAPGGDVEAPDWLSGLGGEQPAPEAPPAEPVGAPDWLSNLAEPSTPAPEGDVEAPDWLSGLSGEQPAPEAPPAGPAGAPDWLSDLGAAPTIPSESPFPAETATPLDADEAPDWLGMMDLEMPDTGLGKPSGGEDLLGLSEDLLTPDETQEDEEIELASGDLPEWLREAAPGEKLPRSAPLTPSADLPPELAAELEGLRFEAITGERGDEKITEKVGALKDVTGVIRPELLFDGASLRADELIDQVIITDEQARRVQAVQTLLAREAEGVVVTGQRRSAVPVVRWLIVLALTAAIVATRFVSVLPEPSAGAAPNEVHEFIEALPAESTVIVAFEYEPDTAAEMQPLAEALLSHLARGNELTVYMLSTRPTGTAMAESALAALERTPTSWANIGYISGGPTGISALTSGVLPGLASPLQTDYRGKALNTDASRLSDLEPSLIIVLAARSEHLRAWVEQAGSQMQTPMVAAVSAGATPLAHPYQQSGQLVAVLSGINDAVAYDRLEGRSSEGELITTWNAQGVGGAAAAALILIGGVIYGLRALRQQQEQE